MHVQGVVGRGARNFEVIRQCEYPLADHLSWSRGLSVRVAFACRRWERLCYPSKDTVHSPAQDSPHGTFRNWYRLCQTVLDRLTPPLGYVIGFRIVVVLILCAVVPREKKRSTICWSPVRQHSLCPISSCSPFPPVIFVLLLPMACQHIAAENHVNRRGQHLWALELSVSMYITPVFRFPRHKASCIVGGISPLPSDSHIILPTSSPTLDFEVHLWACSFGGQSTGIACGGRHRLVFLRVTRRLNTLSRWSSPSNSRFPSR